MVRGITTVQQQKSHSYCLFKSRTKENEKKVYSYIYTKQKQESQTFVEVYWNHNGGSSWFCVWMEGNGYLSSEIDKIFILNFLWTISQRVYSFGRWESCKRNPSLLVCSMNGDLSRSPLSTFQIVSRRWRYPGAGLEVANKYTKIFSIMRVHV